MPIQVSKTVDEVYELKKRGSSEGLLYKAIEEASIGFQIINPAGFIIYSNKAVGEMFQCSSDKYDGKHISEMFVDAEIANKELLPSLIKDQRYECGFTAKRASGETFSARFQGATVKDGQGQLVALVGNICDDADCGRGLDDTELRSMLLDSAKDTILAHDLDFNMIYTNEAGYKNRGYTRDEFMALSLKDIVAPESAARIKERVEILKRDGSIIFESAHTRKDGSIMNVEVYSRLVELNQKTMVSCVIRDITERKQSEAALAKSEIKYRTLLELANDAIFVADAKTGVLIEANQRASQLIGRPISEIIGMHQSELHPPEKAAIYRDLFEKYISQGGGITMELLARHASGRDVPVEISASVFEVDDQTLVKGIFRDLTERHRAKEIGDTLNEVNSIINSTMKPTEAMDQVVAIATGTLGADSAAFFVDEGNHWVLKQVYGPSEDVPGTKLSYDALYPIEQAIENPVPVAISDALNHDWWNQKMARQIGLRSLFLVPLVADNRVLGLLAFRYFMKQGQFTPAELDFGMKLGSAITMSLEKARLFYAQQRIASTLQQALLVVPEELPRVEFGHLYRSATEETLVGGDFYDFFELQGDRVGIAIGDVSGKGLEAATLTSTLKQMIKSYAYEGHSPGAIISKTNIAMVRELGPSTFVTAFMGILDTQSGVLTYCCAGHPPPIIKRQNGDIDVLEPCGPPIGVLDYLEPRDKQQLIRAGDLVTLYTDGVIEARCAGDMFGENRLIDFIRNTTPLSAAELPRRIFDELTSFTGCGCMLSDDLAIVSLSLRNDS